MRCCSRPPFCWLVVPIACTTSVIGSSDASRSNTGSPHSPGIGCTYTTLTKTNTFPAAACLASTSPTGSGLMHGHKRSTVHCGASSILPLQALCAENSSLTPFRGSADHNMMRNIPSATIERKHCCLPMRCPWEPSSVVAAGVRLHHFGGANGALPACRQHHGCHPLLRGHDGREQHTNACWLCPANSPFSVVHRPNSRAPTRQGCLGAVQGDREGPAVLYMCTTQLSYSLAARPAQAG